MGPSDSDRMSLSRCDTVPIVQHETFFVFFLIGLQGPLKKNKKNMHSKTLLYFLIQLAILTGI